MKIWTLNLTIRTLTAVHRVSCIYIFGLLMFTSSLSAQNCPVDLTLFFENETTIGFGKKVDVVLKAKNSNGTPYLGQLSVTDCNISVVATSVNPGSRYYYDLNSIVLKPGLSGFSLSKTQSGSLVTSGSANLDFKAGKVPLFTIAITGVPGEAYKLAQKVGEYYTSPTNLCTIVSEPLVLSNFAMQVIDGALFTAPNKLPCDSSSDHGIPRAVMNIYNFNYQGLTIPAFVTETTKKGEYPTNVIPSNDVSPLIPPTYRFAPVKTQNMRCGVCPDDLDYIRERILNKVNDFRYYWQFLASDATGDFRVSTADMIAIRRILLDIFPQSQKSWTFTSSAHYHSIEQPVLAGQTIPYFDFVEATVNPKLNEFGMYGVKIGDPTGNCTDCNGTPTKCLNFAQTEEVGTTNVTSWSTNDLLTLPIKLPSGIKNSWAQSIGLTINTAAFDIVEVNCPLSGAPEDFLAAVDADKGGVRLSWMSPRLTDVTFSATDVLYNVVLRAKTNGTSLVGLIQSDTTSDNYWMADNEQPKGLSFLVLPKIKASGGNNLAIINAESNEAQLTFSFTADEANRINLALYDITGRSLFDTQYAAVEGFNKLIIPNQFKGSQVIVYQFMGSNQTLSGKLFVK